MVSSIQLGNFFSSGGKTVSGGTGGSGIDTESLVKGLTDAKKLPADNIQKTIDADALKTDALTEFKTLLSTLNDAVSFLRNPPGVGNEAQNAFAYTSASVVSNTSTSADNYITVSSSPGVSPTTYNISEITSVAAAKKQTTASFAVASADVSVTTAAFTAGSFKAGTVAVNGTDITLEAGDTLNEVAAKFNAVKSSTGIIASVVQAGANDFRLIFTATTTGTDADFDLNPPSDAIPADTDGVLSMIGRTNLLSNGAFADDITGWTDASLGTGSIAFGANELTLSGDGAGGNEAFAQQAMTTVIGQQYTVRATLADLTNSAFIRIGTDSDVSNPNNFDVLNQEVFADGTVSFTFTATSTTTYLTVNSDTNTAPIRLDDISVVLSSTSAVSTTQSASDAVFIIDGITVTRQTNSISDVYSGVTFNLKQATPALTTLSAAVSADTTTVKNGIINFINAYNDLRIFAAKQNEVDENTGQYKDTAVLANNSTFRNTVSSITSILTQIVSGITGDDPSRLADIGVTFADLPASADNPLVRNILDLNDGALTSKLAENFDAFRRVFEFDLQSSNADLRVYSRTNALTVSDFTLAFTAGSSPTAVATYDNGSGPQNASFDITEIKDNSTGDVLGYTLKGQSGTPFAGLQLIYASTNSANISVTATQGLADKIFNLTDSVLTKDTGALDTELSSITTKATRLQEQIDKINLDVERFRQQLLEKFSAMEQAIAKVNNLLASIDANNQTRYSS